MFRILRFVLFAGTVATPCVSYGQAVIGRESIVPAFGAQWESDRAPAELVAYLRQAPAAAGGAAGGSGSGGGGAAGGDAAAATDPSAILTQLQFQNVFTPESYGATGYQNTVIVQPVLPFPIAMPGLKEFFPAHIVRPTLPIPAQTADPDGPLGVRGGMSDLTVVDVAVHPIKGFGSALLGYNAVLPTATDRQLGLGEWQLGPAAGLLYKEQPKWLLGAFVTTQFSFQSDAQQINVQPVVVRHLPDQWYVAWGQTFFTFNTASGDYNIPLQARLGKVVKVGELPLNIFLQPYYTPASLHSGPSGDLWGVLLNVTLLFPEKNFHAPLGFLWGN